MLPPHTILTPPIYTPPPPTCSATSVDSTEMSTNPVYGANVQPYDSIEPMYETVANHRDHTYSITTCNDNNTDPSKPLPTVDEEYELEAYDSDTVDCEGVYRIVSTASNSG